MQTRDAQNPETKGGTVLNIMVFLLLILLLKQKFNIINDLVCNNIQV